MQIANDNDSQQVADSLAKTRRFIEKEYRAAQMAVATEAMDMVWGTLDTKVKTLQALVAVAKELGIELRHPDRD